MISQSNHPKRFPAVVIPAFRPSAGILDTVAELLTHEDVREIIIVDDGSGESYLDVFAKLGNLSKNVVVLRHAVNLGKGQALKTAFNYFLLHCQDYPGVVTADADGQHLVHDILRVGNSLFENGGVVLGVRTFGKHVPFRSKIGNLLTSWVSQFVVGRRISDTQTGLRGIATELLPGMMGLKATGYDYEMEMLLYVAENRFKINEVEIQTVYIDDNSSSHFNPIFDSLAIYFVLLRHAGNSLVTALIDYLMFSAAFFLSSSIPLALIAGRLTAGTFNFYVGKKFVFKSQGNFLPELTKYILLVVVLMGFSYFSITYLAEKSNISVYVSKIFVEFLVFLIGFAVQRLFVFDKSEKQESASTNWESYYKNRKKRLHIPRMITQRILIAEIQKNISKNAHLLLELGGGGSCFCQGILAAFSGIHYKIVDKSRTGVEKFVEEHSGKTEIVSAVCEDLLTAQLKEEADLTFSVGLIEHFDQELTAKCIKAHFDATKSGGLVILSYPTPTLLYRIIRSLAEMFGVWNFPDERPLAFAEVAGEVEKYGTIISRRLNWYIGLTQEMIVARKKD